MLDRDGLLRFFLHDYSPTPIIAPWNGGSGFYYQEGKSKAKDPTTGKKIKTGVRDQPTAATRIVDRIVGSKAMRFDAYRRNLAKAKALLVQLNHKEAPKEDDKISLVLELRNSLENNVLEWVDSALVLTNDSVEFPPLFGTGGNDGNTDFTSNFMQRLVEVFDPDTGESTVSAGDWLRQALFADNVQTTVNKSAIGQFFPGAAGGANSTSGFDGESIINPWDYLLMIEGALLFAAAFTKKLESAERGVSVCPFCVRSTGIGYGSASLADETPRPEMWLPLWKRPVTLAELSAIFGEGRAQVGGRAARNGVDFARAVVTLGVDRGIGAFQRYGFQVRNGLAYFATPLERVAVTRNPRADLLADLDRHGWLDRFRSRAKADDAPASATRAILELDARILDLCRNNDAANVQGVLVALGRGEAAMARSPKWRQPAPPTAPLRPVPLLSPAWLDALGFVRQQRFISLGELSSQDSRELRLAAALASVGGYYGEKWFPLRCHLEPVDALGKGDSVSYKWSENPDNDVVWHKGDLVDAMNAVLVRRLIRAEQTDAKNNLPDASRVPVLLGDVAAFIEGRIDDQLFVNLLWGFSLIDWSGLAPLPQRRPKDELEAAVAPSSLYALLKLCFQRSFQFDKNNVVPLVRAIHRHAMRGAAQEASTRAARRLRASDAPPAVEEIFAENGETRRTAAALLFPLTDFWQVKILRQAVGCASDDESTQPKPLIPAATQS